MMAITGYCYEELEEVATVMMKLFHDSQLWFLEDTDRHKNDFDEEIDVIKCSGLSNLVLIIFIHL